jgi:hypothetical protein
LDPADLLYGSDKLVEAHHLNGMAAVHEKRRELTEAQRLYEEALAIYEEVFGSRHFTCALVARNLARVLRVQGKTAEASLLDDHAKDILSDRGDDKGMRSPFGGSAGFFDLMGFDDTAAEIGSEQAADSGREDASP